MMHDDGRGFASATLDRACSMVGAAETIAARYHQQAAAKQAATAQAQAQARQMQDREPSALDRIEANVRELVARLQASGHQAHSTASRGLGSAPVPVSGIGDVGNALNQIMSEPDGRVNAIEHLLGRAHDAVTHLGHGLDRLEQLA